MAMLRQLLGGESHVFRTARRTPVVDFALRGDSLTDRNPPAQIRQVEGRRGSAESRAEQAVKRLVLVYRQRPAVARQPALRCRPTR